MSDNYYNIFKNIQRFVIPALIALIASLGEIYGFDVGKIVGTISALNVFLGAILLRDYNEYINSEEVGTEEEDGEE